MSLAEHLYNGGGKMAARFGEKAIGFFYSPDSKITRSEKMQKVTMLGTGLIGMFYTLTIHERRNQDVVSVVYSRTEESAKNFASQYGIPKWTTDIDKAINDPDTDVVVIGLPNNQHLMAVEKAAKAGKAILCTKPLGRTAEEAKQMLEIVEKAGVFHGYLEDLVYTPKTLKALQAVKDGAVGDVLLARSRETHPGPHSAWFWDKEVAGGGAMVDMGCHCLEICRSFIGKDVRPVEAISLMDTLVHPIAAEDTALAWVRFENGAIAQIESSWTFRGGMDLRDEISGTEGTIWINHWMRTGFEMYKTGSGYVAEKAEAESGWVYPVGDETGALGYSDMFTEMFNSIEKGGQPTETFYDGYVVNAIIDACYRSVESKQWEPVVIDDWRGGKYEKKDTTIPYDDTHILIKEERMPDGRVKIIIQERESGRVKQFVKDE
jgi:predicted dehydrogenase